MNASTVAPANTNWNPSTVAYGSKFERGLDVVEVAKRVRADIADLVASGGLPAARYSVRTSRYSMGRSLDVTISDVPFILSNEERVRYDWESPHAAMPTPVLPRYSDAARALLASVEAIVAAYNFDGSDTMSDCYHVNFYGDVGFDWRQEDRERVGLEQDRHRATQT